MKLHQAVASLALLTGALPLIGACSAHNEKSTSTANAASPAGQVNSVRVCDIRERPEKYLGAVVRIHGSYKSDHMYYSYLVDDSCSSNQTIEVDHPLNTNGDQSVRDFFSAEDRRCEKKGGSVCPVIWTIAVDVLIRKQSNDLLLAEFKHVESYVAPEAMN